jgi:hypothetical protein
MRKKTSETKHLNFPGSALFGEPPGSSDLRLLPELLAGILILAKAKEIDLISSRDFERCFDKFDAWLDNVNLDA